MHYYPHNIGDHKKLTAHFSVLELGAYSLMLDRYFDTETPLLADESRLFRLLRLSSAEEQQAGRRVLQDIFTLTEAGWQHNGCEKAIAHFRSKSAQSARAANLRWKKQSATKANSQPGLFKADTGGKGGKGDGYHELYDHDRMPPPLDIMEPIAAFDFDDRDVKAAKEATAAPETWQASPAPVADMVAAWEVPADMAAPWDVPADLAPPWEAPANMVAPWEESAAATVAAPVEPVAPALCPQCQRHADALPHSAQAEIAPETTPEPAPTATHTLPNGPDPARSPLKPASFVPPQCEPYANALPTSIPITVDSKPPPIRTSPSGERASAKRLPANWQPSEQDIQFCQTERPDLEPHAVAAKFRDYWIAAPDRNGKKADWPATWRNWVRSERSARTDRTGAYRNASEKRLEFSQQLTGQTDHEHRIFDLNPYPEHCSAHRVDQIPF
jgi:uncharacterized protein YdaU (DUF1376 family)